jgi:hypothetical protein
MRKSVREILRCGVVAGAMLQSCGGGLACDGCFDEDWYAPYIQRTDAVTLSAGNAKNQNALSEMFDPWPPYVRNRRLPLNGQRAVGAMERYRDVPTTYGFVITPPPKAPSSMAAPPANVGSPK